MLLRMLIIYHHFLLKCLGRSSDRPQEHELCFFKTIVCINAKYIFFALAAKLVFLRAHFLCILHFVVCIFFSLWWNHLFFQSPMYV